MSIEFRLRLMIDDSAVNVRRMFYLDGGRQMVTELDGTHHEADPKDFDLLEEATRLRRYLEAGALEEIKAARPVLAVLRVRVGALPTVAVERGKASRSGAFVSLAAVLAAIDEFLRLAA